jgi:hypothetical protein
MRNNRENMGGTLSFRRLLSGIAAVCVLGAVFAAPSMARTVYDYEYSGTYIDGSTAGKPFTTGLGGLDYDRASGDLYVANSGEPGWVSRFKLNGTPVNFSTVGLPYVSPSGFGTALTSPTVSVDQYGGAPDGNFYVFGSGTRFEFLPNGIEEPAFRDSEESACGVVPTEDDVLVMGRNGLYHRTTDGTLISEFDAGTPGYEPGKQIDWDERGKVCRPVIDEDGFVYGPKSYFSASSEDQIVKMNQQGVEEYELTREKNSSGVAIDHSNDDVAVMRTEAGFPKPGYFELYDNEGRSLGTGFGKPSGGYLGILGAAYGIAVDPVTHDIWVANKREYAGANFRVEKFVRTNPHVIPGVTATEEGYTDPVGENMELRGTVNPDGVETTECVFEYGLTQQFEASIPCDQGQNLTGGSDIDVTATIPTEKGVRYYYKLRSANVDNGQVARSNTEDFLPQGAIKTGILKVDRVNTDGARFTTSFDPNGGNGSIHFEWGLAGQGFEHSSTESRTEGFRTEAGLFSGENKYLPGTYTVSQIVTGMEPGKTYEYRAAATNEAGTEYTTPQEFTTYVADPGTDPCPNAQARQQSSSSLLPDCRGYELVTARNTGGYDVVSDIVPGQDPLDAYPYAADRMLYSVHFGLIPGMAGSPTNFGLDPYLATRDEAAQEWTTKYVGLPADGMADPGAFGSPIFGADSALSTFAFGGPDICDPCYGDGSTNVPVRGSDGTLYKGMAGTTNPADLDPAGEVRKAMSADGSHLVFGATKKLESTGLEGGLTIYQRALPSGPTEVVSTMPDGSTMTGEVAELDQSSDGSRVLIGKKVGEDVDGNEFFDLYMHRAGNPNSILVADTSNGVSFNGMTDDGSMVYFSTEDQLDGDTDTSVDFFRAEVGTTSPAPITWVSNGESGTGNVDSCEPVTDWNVNSGAADCSIVPLAGGAGVASEDGAAYFLSPETLDGPGNGEVNEPNLYVVRADEDSPEYVGLIDSSAYRPAPIPPQYTPVNLNLITGLNANQSEGMSVNQSTGDIYIAEGNAGGRIARFTSSGAAKNYTEGPNAGTNRLSTPGGLGGGSERSVAVDSSAGPFAGAIYSRSGSTTVGVWNENGLSLGSLTGFGEVCGVFVDGSGDLFVGDYGYGGVRKFTPINAVGPVTKANYTETSIKTTGMNPCHVASDDQGNVYAAGYGTGPLKKFPEASFAVAPPSLGGTEVASTSFHMTATSDGFFYNDAGNKIVKYDSSGAIVNEIGSSAELGGTSKGVAVNAGTDHVYALNGNKAVEFELVVSPYEPIQSPAVLHGVHQRDVHSYEDFQVTPDGRFAVFSTPVPLTGYQNEGFEELYRYDADEDATECPSCAPTGAVGGSDVGLSRHGLNVADDGRVFFTTRESFALRDSNEATDAYEWSDLEGSPKTGLISAGVNSASALASVSADGKNAFFFTRDVLSPKDQTSNAVKIYVAREGGGFVFDVDRQPCKAADECRGAGTETPGAPDIKTGTGSEKPSNPNLHNKKPKCKKGKVRKKGKCVKKHKPKKHKKNKKSKSTRGNG